MKTLLITVGLPRSGKTTWARKQGHPIVNPDSIRLALHGQRFLKEAEPMVWAIAKYMATALFLAGHETVIVDATNNTKVRRAFWVSKDWQTKAVLFGTPRITCIERAKAINDEAIIPVIDRMADECEPFDQETEGIANYGWTTGKVVGCQHEWTRSIDDLTYGCRKCGTRKDAIGLVVATPEVPR